MILVDILLDGLFAAVAGVGFGAISDPPLRAFRYIALLAAVGHACRFCLMTYLGWDIATSSLFADDRTLYSGLITYGTGEICIQHDLLFDHVLADNGRSTGKDEIHEYVLLKYDRNDNSHLIIGCRGYFAALHILETSFFFNPT